MSVALVFGSLQACTSGKLQPRERYSARDPELSAQDRAFAQLLIGLFRTALPTCQSQWSEGRKTVMQTTSLQSRAASEIRKRFCWPAHPAHLHMQHTAWHQGAEPHDMVEREQRPFKVVREQLDLLCQATMHR